MSPKKPDGWTTFIDMKHAVFCFTGKSPKPRSEMEAIAIQAGTSVTKSVTNKTTVLVVADSWSKSAKTKKALSMGIDIISPEDFFEICNNKIEIDKTITNNVAKGSFHAIANAAEKIKSQKTKPLKKKKKHSFTRRIEL